MKDQIDTCIDNFVRDYASGMTVGAVAEKHGLPSHRVLYALHKRNVTFRTRQEDRLGRDFVLFDEEAAWQDYVDGMTLKQVAAKYSTSHATVRLRFLEAGRELRHRGYHKVGAYLHPIDLDAAGEDYQSGMTVADLAEKYQIPLETMRRRLRVSGQEMRPRGQPEGKFLPANGRITDRLGYVEIRRPQHPFANYGYMREHRLVMEEMIGR